MLHSIRRTETTSSRRASPETVDSIGVDPIDARLHASSDQQHLRSACSYIELGMFEEAQSELEKIDPSCRDLPELLAARVPFYRTLEKWDLMAIVAKKLTEWNPEEPGNFIDWAYAVRRSESIHQAHAILTRAAGLHPTDATIQFNLACCESQFGNLDLAKTYLKRAIEIEAKFSLIALQDVDLEPLWGSLDTD
jgi:tetratricopeptide (TPR) repeat protein